MNEYKYRKYKQKYCQLAGANELCDAVTEAVNDFECMNADIKLYRLNVSDEPEKRIFMEIYARQFQILSNKVAQHADVTSCSDAAIFAFIKSLCTEYVAFLKILESAVLFTHIRMYETFVTRPGCENKHTCCDPNIHENTIHDELLIKLKVFEDILTKLNNPEYVNVLRNVSSFVRQADLIMSKLRSNIVGVINFTPKYKLESKQRERASSKHQKKESGCIIT